MSLTDLLDAAGRRDRAQPRCSIGGYFGTWLPADAIAPVSGWPARACRARRDARGRRDRRPAGHAPARSPRRAASPTSSPRERRASAARACNGLDAIADTVHGLASGTAGRTAPTPICSAGSSELPRRGACQHPDGAARFIASALRTFAADFADHARHGPCDRCHSRVLPATASAPAPRAADESPCQPDPVRRPRSVRGAPPRVDPPRPVGLSDPRRPRPARASWSTHARRAADACPTLALLLQSD